MGPEGGDGGGQVVAAGTPEEVAATEASYTGRFLGPVLAKSDRTPVVGELVEDAGEQGPPTKRAATKGATKESAAKKKGARASSTTATRTAPAKKSVSSAATAAARRAKKAG